MSMETTPEEQIAKSIVPQRTAVIVTSKEDEKFWRQFGHIFMERHIRQKFNNPNQQKIWWKRLKTEVLTHYGGGKLACVRCGFLDIRALSLDHIHGGGRKERGNSSQSFYNRLKREGYPEGYQTLCMNCQFIKSEEKGEKYGSRNNARGTNSKIYCPL